MYKATNLENPLTESHPVNVTKAVLPELSKSVNEKIPLTGNKIPLSTASYSINGKELSDDDLTKLVNLNKKYAHVTVGGKHKVVSTKPCPVDGKSLHLESLSEFKSYFLHEDKINGLNVGEAWLSWQGKVFKPDGISFFPKVDLCPMSIYNLFDGFPLTAQKGDVTPFINHINEVICNKDIVAGQFVIGFLAHMLQKPNEKPSVAIVMKSVEGTGKGTMFEPLKKILGAYAVQVNGAYQLTGRFNSVVANKLLVFADEVDLTDGRTADKLKGLISEPRLSLERKGIDPIQVPNLCRFIFASNHETVIKAGNRERRYLVLEPSSKFAQNTVYFNQLWQWIKANGAHYLYEYLLNYDLTNFDPRRAPITKALLEEKLANLSPYQEFLMSELNQERPFDGMIRMQTKQMTDKCRQWLETNNYNESIPKIRSALGKLMSRIGIESIGRSGRDAFYTLPEASIFKDKFSHLLGHCADEIFN
jgi:putative DNA primase/helicase